MSIYTIIIKLAKVGREISHSLSKSKDGIHHSISRIDIIAYIRHVSGLVYLVQILMIETTLKYVLVLGNIV